MHRWEFPHEETPLISSAKLRSIPDPSGLIGLKLELSLRRSVTFVENDPPTAYTSGGGESLLKRIWENLQITSWLTPPQIPSAPSPEASLSHPAAWQQS